MRWMQALAPAPDAWGLKPITTRRALLAPASVDHRVPEGWMTRPQLSPNSALFLDLDGTLLEIAAEPAQVLVPAALPGLLADLDRVLGGAVAIVSGRALCDIDRLLSPFAGSAAGEHGASIRFGDGSLRDMPASVAIPREWHAALRGAARSWPGVLVEAKPHGVAVHYRQAPERRDDVWRLVRALVPDGHADFRLLAARKAVEIAVRGASKGHAVERMMGCHPFAGRVPIFIGDDVTDEDGVAAARRFGGEGFRVAESFGGDPAAVRAWLGCGVERLRRPCSPCPRHDEAPS